MRFASYISICLVSMALVMCKGTQRVTKTNLSYIYQEDPTILHPEYRVFHQNSTESILYVRLKSSEILYSKNNPDKTFRSKLVFNLNVYRGSNSKDLVASDTVFLYDEGGSEKGKYLQGELSIELPEGENYVAEITLDDQYRMQYVQDILMIDKEDPKSDQNFLLKDEKGRILFGHAFPVGSKIFVESNAELDEQLTCKFFDRTGSLPSPPFADQKFQGINFQADSITKLKTTNPQSFEIELDRKGIFHIQSDERDPAGLTFISLDPYFPEIKSLNGMVRPLRFITTKQEYNEIRGSAQLKKSLDDFWFNLAGNAERASDVIRSYYSRVEMSNRYFTSDRAGWKTDRGLIYIIYGPPDVVMKSEHTEIWTYNEKNNVMSVDFTFYRVDSPFSENDYYLGRSSGYKSSWYRAIDNWRQGRVF